MLNALTLPTLPAPIMDIRAIPSVLKGRDPRAFAALS